MFTDILVSILTTVCMVETSNETHLSTSKVCLFVNLKPQTNTADKGVVLL